MKFTLIEERCMYCGSPASSWPLGGCVCWTKEDS